MLFSSGLISLRPFLLAHPRFSSFEDKENLQRGHRHRGASFEVRRPQGGTSRQCPIFVLCPFAPLPAQRQPGRAGRVGHAPAEPLEECGHKCIVWGTFRLNNQVEERFEPPLRAPFRGCRPKASLTRPSVSEPMEEGCVARPRWIPEEASSAQPFSGLLDRFREETGVSRSAGINPVCLNAGLMKPWKGIYLGRAIRSGE